MRPPGPDDIRRVLQGMKDQPQQANDAEICDRKDDAHGVLLTDKRHGEPPNGKSTGDCNPLKPRKERTDHSSKDAPHDEADQK